MPLVACLDTLREGIMAEQQSTKVIVTDVDMPFGSMVMFMVKWSIATIPALIILVVAGSVF